MQLPSQTQCVGNQCGRIEISPFPDVKKSAASGAATSVGGAAPRSLTAQHSRRGAIHTLWLVRFFPADRVNIRRDRLQLVRLERSTTIGRHRTADLLRLGDTLSDG